MRAKWLAGVLIPAAALYGGYFMYLAALGKMGASPEQEVFLELARAVLKPADPHRQTYSVGYHTMDGWTTCRFFTFDAVRVGCRGVTVVVKNHEGGMTPEIHTAVNAVSDVLAAPCENLQLLPLKDRSRSAAALGCGIRPHTFKLHVEAISSKYFESSSGGGSYKTTHLHTVSGTGRI